MTACTKYPTLRIVKTILYLYQDEFWMRARRLAGICKYAQANALRVRRAAIDQLGISIREAMEIFRPDGCIIEAGLLLHHRVKPTSFSVPVVVCDGYDAQFAAGFTGTRHNSEGATNKAIDALLELDRTDYAYIGYHQSFEWSQTRQLIFQSRMQQANRHTHIFPWRNADNRKRLPHYIRALSDWIAALPHPCGILAANDEIGEYILDAAARAKIRVPDDLAVIGIDNDEFRCENTTPPLASVSPDFEHSGRRAAEILADLITNPGSHPLPAAYDSGDVQRRGSLRPLKVHDEAAARALAYIAKHYTEPIGIATIAKIMEVGPRMAQIRFTRFAGKTIFAEIEDARFHRACTLLRNPHTKLNTIVNQCGYKNERTFRNLFLKRTGLAPSRWRETHT